MHITNFKTANFKNLQNIDIRPSEGINLFIGDNAQGKTNILENIYILTGCKSFRTNRDRDLVNFNQQYFYSCLDFFSGDRFQKIEYGQSKAQNSDKRKSIKLNGIQVKSGRVLFENFKCVVFTPDDAVLITGASEIRRKFFDLCVSQIVPGYMGLILRYNNIILQRNAALKSKSIELISLYDDSLIVNAIKIQKIRQQYTEIFREICKNLYSEITNYSEDFNVKYYSNVCEDFKEKLRENIQKEIYLGYTLTGVHRDEFLITINGKSVRDFGSSGQKKSCALCMKLAQSKILTEKSGEKPVILLDDVMAELDGKRTSLIYKTIEGMQTFITSCIDINIENSKIFTVKEGNIYE